MVEFGVATARPPARRFPNELWFAAAWADNVGRALLGLAINDVPLVIYRTDAGEAVALSDTCPHRFAPLHLGRLEGDTVECGYHGLRFGKDGACIFNPHGNGATPQAARLRSYPVREQDGLIWVWMGDPANADPDNIPDFPALSDPNYAFTAGHTMHMALAAELIVDNLLDLSHAAYLHAATLGAAPRTKDVTSVARTGTRIHSNRMIPNSAPAPVFVATGAATADDKVDYWANMRWDPPGSFSMDAGIVTAGGAKEDGRILSSVQIVTPSTADTSIYFWKMYRNFSMTTPGITEAIEAAVTQAFTAEDEPMIAAVQARMAGRDFWSMRPLLLAGDSAAVQARRVLQELLQRETR